MIYEIYDGPRQLENGLWYWAIAAWDSESSKASGRGSATVRDKDRKTQNCDLANDFLANFQTTHTRLVVDQDGNLTRISDGAKIPQADATGRASDYESESFEVSIESQVEQAIQAYLGRAVAKNYRGNKVLPVDHSDPRAVEKYLERKGGGK